ncbi:replication factor A protein 1-like [Rutidosis leptorrhynchoides]|uniref:replication factor A protein 1-like n=1 Tax=Rutidosis leptorrhynchoides TaxID=125765 RepID=UPI003A996276
MAQITALAQLTPGDRDKTISARIYRKWVTYIYHNQTPTGYWCMLIDEMHYPMLVNMRYSDKAYFDELMHLNKMYVITNFSVHVTTRWEKILPGPTTLSFNRNTVFEDLPFADYPDHYFQFVAYNQLLTRVPNTTVLADYIGCIDRLEDPVVIGDVNRKQLIRRTIDITNLDGDTIQLTLWNERATSFDSIDIVISIHHRERFLTNPPLIINRQRSPDMAIERFRNRFALQELLTHNLNNSEYGCHCTIEQVGGNRDWYYKSYSECLLKVTEDIDVPNSYTCRVHGTKGTYTPTYCFKIIVNDTSNTTYFTFFSEAGDVIVGTTYSDLVTNRGYDQPHELPPIIRAIEGQTHIFQFHYNPQSRKTHPEFIVTRLLDEIPNVAKNNDPPNSSTEVEDLAIAEVATDSTNSTPPSTVQLHIPEQPKKGKPEKGNSKKPIKRALFTEESKKGSTRGRKKRDVVHA